MFWSPPNPELLPCSSPRACNRQPQSTPIYQTKQVLKSPRISSLSPTMLVSLNRIIDLDLTVAARAEREYPAKRSESDNDAMDSINAMFKPTRATLSDPKEMAMVLQKMDVIMEEVEREFDIKKVKGKDEEGVAEQVGSVLTEVLRKGREIVEQAGKEGGDVKLVLEKMGKIFGGVQGLVGTIGHLYLAVSALVGDLDALKDVICEANKFLSGTEAILEEDKRMEHIKKEGVKDLKDRGEIEKDKEKHAA